MTYPLDQPHDVCLCNLNRMMITNNLDYSFLRIGIYIPLGDKNLGITSLCDAFQVIAAFADDQSDIFVWDSKFVNIAIEWICITNMN